MNGHPSGLLRTASRRPQQGAAAIEFALVFTIFFAVLYGIISYALVFTLSQGFSFAANEAARSAIAIDRTVFPSEAAYLSMGVEPRVKETVRNTLSWLPAKAYAKAVGASEEKIRIEAVGTDAIRVTITYPDYKSDPLIPILSLPGIGDVPRVPNDLRATAVVGL